LNRREIKLLEVGENCIMRSFITCMFYSSPSEIRMIKSRRMKWVGHAARMGEKKRIAYKILVGKLEGKRPLGRPRHRWVDDIKMDLREIEWGGKDWTDLAQDMDQWTGSCEHGNEPSGSINC
jgi:hypothetical protein